MNRVRRSAKALLLSFAACQALLLSCPQGHAQIGEDALKISGRDYGVWTVAFSPDGKRLLVRSLEGVMIYDAVSGKILGEMEGEPRQYGTLVFSPDGKSLAGVTDWAVSVYDSETFELRFKTEHQINTFGEIALAWSPDGQWIATPNTLLKASSGEVAGRLCDEKGKGLFVEHRVAFSPDSRKLYGIVHRRDEKEVVSCSLPDGLAVAATPTDVVFDTANPIGAGTNFSLSPDGRLIAMRCGGHIVIQSLEAGGAAPATFEHHHPGYEQVGMTFTPSSKSLAVGMSGGRAVDFHDVRSGKISVSIDLPSGSVRSIAFSSDSSRMAVGLGWGTSHENDPSVLVFNPAAAVKAKRAAQEAAAKEEAERVAELKRRKAEEEREQAEEEARRLAEQRQAEERMAAQKKQQAEDESRRLAEREAAEARRVAELRKREADEAAKRLAEESKKAEEAKSESTFAENAKPKWEGFEDLNALIKGCGPFEDVPIWNKIKFELPGFVHFGSPENAAKARAGDRFDKEDAKEAAREHLAGLPKRKFFLRLGNYSWVENESTDAAVVLWTSSPGCRAMADGLGVTPCDHGTADAAFLTKDGSLKPAPGFSIERLRAEGAEVYVVESAISSGLRIHVSGERDVLKAIAREPDRHVVTIGLTNLRLDAPFQYGWFRHQRLVEMGFDTQRVRGSYDAGLDGGDRPNYFVTKVRKEVDDREFPPVPCAEIVRIQIVRREPDGRATVVFEEGK